MADGFELDGMAALQSRLAVLGAKATLVNNRAVKAGGEVLAEVIRENVPVSSVHHQHIKDDIVVSGIKNAVKAETHVTVGPGKDTAWRARFLEFGTVKMSAQPFLDTSATDAKVEVKEAIKNVIRAELGL